MRVVAVAAEGEGLTVAGNELVVGVCVAAAVGDGVVDFVGLRLLTGGDCWLLQPTKTRSSVSGVKRANRDLFVNTI
ncbi:hypothetical protein LJR153_006385 [Paenibacillus sp. LjRoot153]